MFRLLSIQRARGASYFYGSLLPLGYALANVLGFYLSLTIFLPPLTFFLPVLSPPLPLTRLLMLPAVGSLPIFKSYHSCSFWRDTYVGLYVFLL